MADEPDSAAGVQEVNADTMSSISTGRILMMEPQLLTMADTISGFLNRIYC